MANWINLSTATGSGNTTITVTANTLNDLIPRTASYKVSTPNGETKIVNLEQVNTDVDELTVFYDVATTGSKRIFNALSGNTFPEKVYRAVDGGDYELIKDANGWISGATRVDFTSTGTHYVKYRFENPSDIVFGEFLRNYYNDTYTIDPISVIIPSKYRTIDTYAFANPSIKTIYIQEGLSEIKEYAFWRVGLTAINLPSSLRVIGNSAFRMSDLTSINIPYGVVSIGDSFIPNMSVYPHEKGVFSACEDLEDVYLPDSVSYINPCCFEKCNKLKNIRLNDNLTSIPAGTFGRYDTDNSGSLTEITIPDSVTTIGTRSFEKQQNLKKITFSSTSNIRFFNYECLNECFGLKTLTIPSSVIGMSYIGNVFGYNDVEEGQLKDIYAYPSTPPVLIPPDNQEVPYPGPASSNPIFRWVPRNGVLHYPAGSDYSSWMGDVGGLTARGWTAVADL